MAFSDWYTSHPEWAIPGNAPLMSDPIATIPDMNHVLERLVQLKAAATDTRGQIDYLDQVLTDAVVICRRPGDVERCATFLDELIAEVATTRATQRPPEGAYTAEQGDPGTSTGAR